MVWRSLILVADSEGGGQNAMVVLLLVVGVSLMVLVLTRRRIAQRQSGSASSRRADTGRSFVGRDASRRQLEKSMQELLIELEELSREINSQVDTRLRALNLLVQEADEKIRELRRLQGLDAEGGGPERHLPPPKREPHPEETSERYARVYALAERGHSVVEIAREMEMMTGEVELILALRRTAAGRPEDAS